MLTQIKWLIDYQNGQNRGQNEIDSCNWRGSYNQISSRGPSGIRNIDTIQIPGYGSSSELYAYLNEQ